MQRVRIVSACAALALAGCQHETKSGEAPAEPAAAPSAPAESAPRAEYHEDTFDLTMVPSAPLTAGKPGSVEIRLVAKAGYHPNDKYPYKFKVAEGPGVKYTAPVFTKDAVKLEDKQARLSVDFTPVSAGPTSVGGTFSFSLCSAERCLVEKRDLVASLQTAAP